MIIGFRKIGDVRAYSATEISQSRIGIGFEKLDRAVFDPTNAYDPVCQLGVKWVRLQSGWQRTETAPGIYHFEWLDDIVDNMLRRSLQPWICLCYGNRIYDQLAAERFGGVGCPPNGPDELPQWLAYVKATVKHFEGRVTWWEIWNEPDCPFSWRYHQNLKEYGSFACETAKAIHEASPEAKAILGAFSASALPDVKECFDQGPLDYCDAVSFHVYSANEAEDDSRIANLRRMVNHYHPGLDIIQGEGGCQSRHDGCGALSGQHWTPEKQAKSLARHLLSQLAYGCKFVSYFSCMDMIEALLGKVGDKASYMDFGYFGVLGAEFDEDGIARGTYTPKPSYRSLQVIASLLREEVTCTDDVPYLFESGIGNHHYGWGYQGADQDGQRLFTAFFRKPNGSVAMAYWAQTHILRESYEGSLSIRLAHVPKTCKLVDVVDGAIYELNEADCEFDSKGGTILLKNVPCFDRPIMLCFGEFL